ncbi:hypothetical protein JG687_00005615 [Phytophthora cactorum]|uniref:Transmembrane protein n=1 Tax=Phytophthora cactorum TaxID=29920 RepID=A0A8T1ULQ9_9STRA|nr:hypothetical protein JG687_00005615 [Phytophthora cactorum]
MGALAQVWHGSAALLAWTIKLVRTPHTSSLPSAVSSPSARSSVWSFLTAGPRRARRQSHAALELLEKFRHGPETHSEWNLFLWRATFPLVSLVLLTLLCVAGQFGHAAYSLLVNPVWYLCNLALVITPFLLVFRFSGLEAADGEPQTKIWYGVAAISFAISLVEWYMSLPASRYSWIVGNTLFGIVALGAVPLFFSMQPRTARSQYDDLVMEQEQEMMRVVPEEDEDVDDGGTRRLTRQRSAGRLRELEMQRQRQPTMTRLLYGCGFCTLALWLIMFSSYSSARGEPATRSWFLLYMLSPVLCIVLFCSRVAKVRFSFEHAVAYSTLVVHVPLFLGHLCVRLFALAEDPTASSPTSTESWLKLAVSVLYLLLMQGYFFVITHTVNSMSEPFAHPSLLYIGQLYYYTFWYCLVGSDTPIDALYWGMLLLNNIHIAFLNTGVYTDFKRTSSAWTATSDALRPLYFLMKLAEQDNMADTTALILVPSLLTLLAVFEKPGSALAVLQDQTNLWLRCVCMFIGRLGGSFLAREIFTCKLRSRLRSAPEDTTQPDPISGSIDGMPARLWIQRLMLQDFHAQFWYLTAVTVVVTFGCFARIDLPLRFALL